MMTLDLGSDQSLVDDLRRSIQSGAQKPLIICGAGVSIEATNGKAPSWAELIENGIKRALKLNPSETDWAAYARSRLARPSPDKWVEVADEVARLLGSERNAEFGDWIAEEVQHLVIERRELLDAILALGCPLATTNYDDVLSQASGSAPITWKDHDQVLKFLSGTRSSILHLHGHWRRPETVVLGSRSYAELSGDHRASLMSEFAALSRPTVFVGCSAAGLTDPDFTRLAGFVTEWQASAPRRYWLMRNNDASGLPQTMFGSDSRLYPIEFGSANSDLPRFLTGLILSGIGESQVPQLQIRSIDKQEPCPEIFGRDENIREIVDALLEGRSAVIAGGPGFGKTALAVNALYARDIVGKFGERRVFVSLESDSEPRAILARLAEALGLIPTGDDASLLRQLELGTAARPTVAILDNLETLFDQAWEASERLIQLANQVPELSLVLTLRGAAPRLPHALVINDLPKLDPPADKRAFVAITGGDFESDPGLDPLLVALDGHALSIQLVAARAIGASSLADLLDAWNEVHAAILKDPYAVENRLTSVRASLALSLNSPILRSSPLSRRLLSIISLLPGGAREDQVSVLLGERGTIPKAKATQATAVLQRLRLIERRMDRRLRMLNPLRECVKLDLNIQPKDRGRVIRHFTDIAKDGRKAGTLAWSGVKVELQAEILNLDPMCSLAFEHNSDSEMVFDALIGLAQLRRINGIGGTSSLFQALYAWRKTGEFQKASTISYLLGIIKFSDADVLEAIDLYEQGKILAADKRFALEKANCLFGLAEAHLAMSEHGTAITYYDQALKIYSSIRDDMSQANCWYGIAKIDYRGDDVATAKSSLEYCRSLYEGCGDRLGVTNAKALIAILDRDKKEMDAIISIYRELGVLGSELSALIDLAWMEAVDGSYDKAMLHVSEGVRSAQQAGLAQCEGIAVVRRGQIFRISGRGDGIEDITSGFALYRSTPKYPSKTEEGLRLLEIALLSTSQSERLANLETAKHAWANIGRYDLIREWSESRIMD